MGIAQQWQPATSKERYKNVDIIRGLALFGVLIVNLLSDFRVPLLEHIQQPYPDDGRLNHCVDLFAGGFLEFKALTIFSVLFGVGVAIQGESLLAGVSGCPSTMAGTCVRWHGIPYAAGTRFVRQLRRAPRCLRSRSDRCAVPSTKRQSILRSRAAIGRMALTNYVLQSVALGFLFYGYGFGLFGRIGSAAGAALGVVIYALQVLLSRRWLQRFRFGPLEWLWRCLSYARWQPMSGGAPISGRVAIERLSDLEFAHTLRKKES